MDTIKYKEVHKEYEEKDVLNQKHGLFMIWHKHGKRFVDKKDNADYFKLRGEAEMANKIFNEGKEGNMIVSWWTKNNINEYLDQLNEFIIRLKIFHGTIKK